MDEHRIYHHWPFSIWEPHHVLGVQGPQKRKNLIFWNIGQNQGQEEWLGGNGDAPNTRCTLDL